MCYRLVRLTWSTKGHLTCTRVVTTTHTPRFPVLESSVPLVPHLGACLLLTHYSSSRGAVPLL